MDVATVIIAALAALGGACVVGVFWLSFGRRPRSIDTDPDVNELAHEVAALQKQVRRAYMQRVRAGEGAPEATALAPPAPPELQPGSADLPSAPGSSPRAVKDALRAAIFSNRRLNG